SDLVGKYVNIAAHAAGFIAKRFEGRLKNVSGSELLAKLAAQSEAVAADYETREYARALREIMALADIVNEYVDANKPWELAKQEGQSERLHQVCSELINAFAMLTAYLAPVLPKVAENAARFLNLPEITWANTRETLGEHTINKYEHLMQRVEQKQVDNLIEANKQSIQTTSAAAAPAETNQHAPVAEQAGFDDFMKIDMRVAKVLNCQAVEGSTKLLKFDLDFGFEQRVIFSGIAASYPNPAELNGRMVIAVANFAPRKMAKFGVSEGMILSAATADGKLKLLDVDAGAQPGDKVG
ncbi:methionine--tRNA ligase subunit beta, partial [Neisseria sp.]|uniref:methionine--tRNA ligase subunit beta n=1 Tax=Neisseria sp. TaxID=192066 RepID=UPI0035A17F8C